LKIGVFKPTGIFASNGWWEFAQTEKDSLKKQLQNRASYWYGKALPGLKGLQESLVQKRLTDIQKTAESNTERNLLPKLKTPFDCRSEPARHAFLRTYGGTTETEVAVEKGLNWLYCHQTANGKWSLDVRYQCKNGTCSGPGTVRSDEAATAMALLPFLAAGLSDSAIARPSQQPHCTGKATVISLLEKYQ
jgi:hypothetical protein